MGFVPAGTEQGIAVMEEAITAADAARTLWGWPVIRDPAEMRTGAMDNCRAPRPPVRAAQAVSSDSRWVEPEVRRIEALLARAIRPQEVDPAAAEAGLERAAECARTLGLPVFELRCLLDLKSLLGPSRQRLDVDSRIEELAYVRDVDRRAESAVRTRAPSLYLEQG
jgi:hypothetical protein